MVFICLHGAIADPTGHHASIVIGGTDVIGGKPDVSGAKDRNVVNGEPAVISTINAIGVDGTMIVTIAGNPFA